jgi:hypothetical protein
MWGKAQKKPVTVKFRVPVPNGFFCKSEYGNIPFEPLSELENWKRFSLYYDFKFAERIETLEGVHFAFPDKDWVIEGIKGEIYIMEKDFFDGTYDVIQPITQEKEN